MATFVFLRANSPNVAAGETLVRTTGHTVDGKGAADYVYDQNAADNTLTTFTASDGRRFRLAEIVRTPYMFGCTGATDGSDTAGLQAFFDDARSYGNICRYDWSGEWHINQTIEVALPFSDAAGARTTFICGRLRVLPRGTSAPLEYVMDVAAPNSNWIGTLAINPSGSLDYGLAWNARRYVNGLRRRLCTQSSWGDIKIDDTRRHLVVDDTFAQSFTLRANTPHQTSYTFTTNIGMRTRSITGRWHGSTFITSPGDCLAPSVSGNAHGGVYLDRFETQAQGAAALQVSGTIGGATLTAGNQISINGTIVTLTGTTPASLAGDINNANIANVQATIAYVGGDPTLYIRYNSGGTIALADVTGTPLASMGVPTGSAVAGVAAPVSYGGSSAERSRLTVDSSAELIVGDQGKMRHEITSATFGTVAVDATARTITWSAGDPVAAGLAVGDYYYIENTSNSLYTNEQIPFEIVGFSGTSNRVIKIWPHTPSGIAFSTDAARSTLKLVSEWTYHTVMAIPTATAIEVYPWVPARHNSAFYGTFGAVVYVNGGETANTQYDALNSIHGPCGLWSAALYGPRVGSIKMDHGDIGIRLGQASVGSSVLGTVVEHAHLEGVVYNVFAHSVNSFLNLTATSVGDMDRCFTENARVATNQLFAAPAGFKRHTHDFGGQLVIPGAAGAYETADLYSNYLSNEPRNREMFVHLNSGAVTVKYDRHLAGHYPKNHWARLIWTGPSGGAPTGTLTLSLTQELIDKGWAFPGGGTSYAIAAPGTTLRLELQFLEGTKIVSVMRTNGA